MLLTRPISAVVWIKAEGDYARIHSSGDSYLVYRTLNELVEAGLLRKMTLGNRSVYEHDYGYPQHDHLHCTECDKLIEFQTDELAGLLARREALEAPAP